MGRRDFLFLAIVAAGGLVLYASVFPPVLPPRAANFDPAAVQTADFRATVDAVNAEFRAEWRGRWGTLTPELQPAIRADDRILARRLSLALMGAIPSLQEMRQLEKYEGPERVQWYLAGILEDERSADYLAERFARAFVGTEGGPFLVYRRRRFVTWLREELVRNRPFDEIVRHMIAAEGLWTDEPATNFLTASINPASENQPDPEKLVGRVARAFLGVRMDCAQCHDHFFDVWTQQDFRGLAAFFGQTRSSLRGVREGDGEFTVENRKKERETVSPRVPYQPELLPNEGPRRERLARWVTSPQNLHFARAATNRVWALLFGRPLVTPLDNITIGHGQHAVLDILARDFAARGYNLRRLIQTIVATEVFQLDSAAPGVPSEAEELALERAWAAFPLTRLRPDQVAGSIVQAASLQTINHDSHIVVQLAKTLRERNFVKHYGDTGEDEFEDRGGTVPQRLIVMNGELVKDHTKPGLFTAAARIAFLSPDDRTAVQVAFLTVLSRHPTAEEATYFEKLLAAGSPNNQQRMERLEDLFWRLLNTTEFAWNH
jgi:hypothetical protein